ncbi:hypothetical protein [Salinicoccus sp. CNSTN-B1]
MNNDIYFTREYGRVNELIENGEAVFFELKSKDGHITHSTIKREIPDTVGAKNIMTSSHLMDTVVQSSTIQQIKINWWSISIRYSRSSAEEIM